jgi:hypothetical protein
MGKHGAVKTEPTSGPGKRQPCPCGSGKRYKACHGAEGGVGDVMVARPFEGLAAECELVAMREFVPSATVELPVDGERTYVLATVLPMAAAALVRADGTAMVGMQTQTRSGDVSRDLARAVLWAGKANPGDVLSVVGKDDGGTERFQDLIAADTVLTPELHKDFAWWIPEGADSDKEVAMSIERANAAIMPTERLAGVDAAYWVDAGDKAHVRWVRNEPEEKLLAALARLHVRGELGLGEGSRYAGSFRAHGLLVPVWDLDPEMHAREWEPAARELSTRIDAALASFDDEELTPVERRAIDGLRGRQITLR